jgi:ergothioneine biosynthesis protein EgtB
MDREALARRYGRVRARSEALFAPLAPEDWRVQSMPDVSPPYWNLGHTSWFFAANLLRPFAVPFVDPPGFDYAFNSYYEGLGPRLPRARRGSVAQPSTEAVFAYRRAVDDAVLACIERCPPPRLQELERVLAIGLEHEEQHQELALTEILHIRWSAPEALRVAFAPPMPRSPERRPAQPAPGRWPGPTSHDGAGAGAVRAVEVRGGPTTLGHAGDGFCWDNELPAHRVHVPDLAFGARLITNAEWLAFVDDGGYRSPLLWLSNGWNAVQQHGWHAPLYWERHGDGWARFTLRGVARLEPNAPVSHVSFYEADAFARWLGEQQRDWRGARLPRESEWEHAARVCGFDQRAGNLLDDDVLACALAPLPANGGGAAGAGSSGVAQMAGDAWEWTSSHYEAYPGYRPFGGALMEYNGKFMDNQRVLRGGSFATPRGQARAGYRNFWPAETRFQVSGVRVVIDR